MNGATGAGTVVALAAAAKMKRADLASPGLRVIGQDNIARLLGISCYQLRENLRTRPMYRRRIRRVKWLMVANLLDVIDLGVSRADDLRLKRAAAGSLGGKKRHSNS
ncbi:MAG: hypothetical protein JSS29_11075 [Proteobacteria bacterium]|nr:hypothetical protein [Pseudomonadota bacterium]